MFNDHFNEIIDYAVEKEQEAVEFYQYLQKQAKFSAQRKMLEELENMEKGHIQILENIRCKGFEKLQPKKEKIEDLKISNYMVEKELGENMDYEDILIIAMKREEASYNLYTDLAMNFEHEETSQLFQRLAAEEAAHKHKFEVLYDEDILKDN